MTSKIPKLRKKTRSNSEKRKKTKRKRNRDTVEEDDNEHETKPAEKEKQQETKQPSIQQAPQPPSTPTPTPPNNMDPVRKLVDWVVSTHTSIGLGKFFNENLATYIPPPEIYKYSGFSDNKFKNRYKDVVCLDATRVILSMEGYSSDYIHANHVTFPDFDRKFIATQYPLEDTTEDFWRMIFDESVDTIISMCNPKGDPDIKPDRNQTSREREKEPVSTRTAHPFNFAKSTYQLPTTSVRELPGNNTAYWPLREGSYTTYGKMFVHTRKIEIADQKTSPSIYTVEVLPEGCSNCNFVKVINYPSWPKSSLPSSPRVVLKLIKKVREIDPLQTGPVVIHCDGGINRSGVVILTDLILTRIYSGKSVDVVEVFKRLRNQRASCIQSQYLFIYVFYCVTEYIRLRCMKGKSQGGNSMTKQIMELHRDFTKILKDVNTDRIQISR